MANERGGSISRSVLAVNASHRRGKCACVTVSILPLYMYVAS